MAEKYRSSLYLLSQTCKYPSVTEEKRESLCSCSGQTNCTLAKERLLEPIMKEKGRC